MAVNQNYLNFILDQLSDLEDFTFKKMFGGVGFFKDGKMFGAIMGGTFRLKADETSQADFEAYDMEPFYYKGKPTSMPYWEVPAEILEDRQLLKQWAEKAHQIAMK